MQKHGFSKLLVALSMLMLSFSSLAATQDKTQANKALVVEFYEEILFKGNFDKIDKYIGSTYIQHNPGVADGKEALIELLKSFGPVKAPWGEIVRTIAEDNLVVLHVKNYNWPAPRGSSVVDIFRVEAGKIVEHWDTIQAVPETSANDNGMF